MKAFEDFYSKHQELDRRMNEAATEDEKDSIRREYQGLRQELRENGEAFAMAYGYYHTSRERGNNRINIGHGLETPWPKEVKPLIDYFRAAGVKEFTYSATCSNALEVAWLFTENGCSLEGLTKIRNGKSLFKEEYDEVPAYLFKIN